MSGIQERLKTFKLKLEKANLDAILIIHKANVRYLSNYQGDEALILVSRGRQFLITDHRFSEQAEQECPDYQIVIHKNSILSIPSIIRKICIDQDIKKLAFEPDYMSYKLFLDLKNNLDKSIKLVSMIGMVEDLRYIKSCIEVEILRQACQATDKVFSLICEYIRPGVSEKNIARELNYMINDQDCENSFPVIVASGANGSLPHAIPTDKLLKNNEFIILDFGCKYKGYHADMTRTLFLGNPDNKQQEIYNIVLAAKYRAESLIKNGVSGHTLDSLARDFINKKGYGIYFKHGLGHGVGLDIHENPIINQECKEILKTGCLTTIEPGIYLPGWGGVRIEDTILVNDESYEYLTNSERDLICL